MSIFDYVSIILAVSCHDHCRLPLQHSIWQSVMVMPGASSAARHQQSTKQISAIFLRTMQFSILQAQYELITGQRVGNTSVYFDTNIVSMSPSDYNFEKLDED